MRRQSKMEKRVATVHLAADLINRVGSIRDMASVAVIRAASAYASVEPSNTAAWSMPLARLTSLGNALKAGGPLPDDEIKTAVPPEVAANLRHLQKKARKAMGEPDDDDGPNDLGAAQQKIGRLQLATDVATQIATIGHGAAAMIGAGVDERMVLRLMVAAMDELQLRLKAEADEALASVRLFLAETQAKQRGEVIGRA